MPENIPKAHQIIDDFLAREVNAQGGYASRLERGVNKFVMGLQDPPPIYAIHHNAEDFRKWNGKDISQLSSQSTAIHTMGDVLNYIRLQLGEPCFTREESDKVLRLSNDNYYAYRRQRAARDPRLYIQADSGDYEARKAHQNFLNAVQLFQDEHLLISSNQFTEELAVLNALKEKIAARQHENEQHSCNIEQLEFKAIKSLVKKIIWGDFTLLSNLPMEQCIPSPIVEQVSSACKDNIAELKCLHRKMWTLQEEWLDERAKTTMPQGRLPAEQMDPIHPIMVAYEPLDREEQKRKKELEQAIYEELVPLFVKHRYDQWVSKRMGEVMDVLHESYEKAAQENALEIRNINVVTEFVYTLAEALNIVVEPRRSNSFQR